jgi:hypothetical protein
MHRPLLLQSSAGCWASWAATPSGMHISVARCTCMFFWCIVILHWGHHLRSTVHVLKSHHRYWCECTLQRAPPDHVNQARWVLPCLWHMHAAATRRSSAWHCPSDGTIRCHSWHTCACIMCRSAIAQHALLQLVPLLLSECSLVATCPVLLAVTCSVSNDQVA